MSDDQPTLPLTSLPPGMVIADYQIGMRLGSGGMADVYYAIDRRLDRAVALKLLRPALAADEIYRQRFLQEAKAAASLVHPNIVQIYSVGESDQFHYIAQEYIPGTNLRQYLQLTSPGSGVNGDAISDRQLPIKEALSILLQVLAGLSKAASVGIVHRDIKPENIMLTPEGEAKVADFGLARITQGNDPRLTNAGTTLGTPMYMSPEQLEGGLVDIRSDLYSLGVTLFHMIYGRPPFTGDTPLALAMQHVTAELPETALIRSAVPDSLEQLVRRLLSKSPADRFQHPEEILDYLHQHRADDLSQHWPDRVVPIPGVALALGTPLQATQQLKTLLQKPRRVPTSLWIWSLASAVLFAAGAWLTHALTQIPHPSAEQIFLISEFNNVPRQDSAKQQYEWALVEKSPNFKFSKWEAVSHYFPKSDSPINRLYSGLAQLQSARAYAEVRDDKKALEQLTMITQDAQAPVLVQVYAWLEIAAVENLRNNTAETQRAVERALQLREGLSRADLDQLEETVKSLPSDIELYWSPAAATS
jgi:eukaryotic-like serine/threonine-protein kinase